MSHGYIVALFDVLGFEQRLARLGLQEMLVRYEALIDAVNYRKEQIKDVFETVGFEESPYWLSDGDIFTFSKTHGAYASDSILIWSNRTWPEAREIDVETKERIEGSPAERWKLSPIPCDHFLNVCNDLICRSLEVGLPLRGAIAVGDAVLDQEKGLFLGQPIIDAARMESSQILIGTSFCKSAINQIIPARFSLQFSEHIKENSINLQSGLMLDWPRHWRNTRKTSLIDTINKLNIDSRYASYYENTLELIAYSQLFSEKYESLDEISIRTLYEPFSWSNKALSARVGAVRRVPIERDE